MKHIISTLSIIFMFTALAPASHSLTLKAPLDVQADQLEILPDAEQATFSGNVHAKQQKFSLKADKLVLNFKGEAIKDATASNNVVVESGNEVVRGEKAVYNPKVNTLTITGKTVTVKREETMLKGTRLVYNLKTGHLNLTSSAKSSGRIKAVIVPKP